MTRIPKIVLGLIAGILLLLALLLAAPFTDVGSRLVIGLANDFSPVDIEYDSGSLLSRIELTKIELETDSFDLRLDRVSAALETSCLWRSIFCFPDFRAEKITVNWAGGQWRNGALRARISLSETQILVEELELQDADFALENENQEGETASDMPEIGLPLALIVEELTIHNAHWRVGETEAQHSLISVKGNWIDTLLQLDKVAISSKDIGVFTLSGQLSFSGDWPFELDTIADFDSAFSPAQYIDLPTGVEDTALHTSWLLSARGTADKQNFSASGALGGLGYDSLELFAEGQYEVLQSDPGESQFLLSRFELRDKASSSSLYAEANITLGEQGHASFSINTSGFTIPALANGVAGRLSGAVKGQGSFSAVAWRLALEEIELTGELNGRPAQVHGHLDINEKLLFSKTQLSADLNGAHLSLSAAERNNDGAELNVIVEDLGLWVPGSSGRVETEGVLTAGLSALTFNGRVQDFRWQTIAFENSELNGKVTLGSDFPFVVTAAASHMAIDSIALDSLQLEISGNTADQSASLRSVGEFDGAIQISGRATTEGWQGQLDPTRLTTPAGPWQLERKVALDWVSSIGQFRIDSHCWLTTDAKVCPDPFVFFFNDDSSTITGGAVFTGGLSALASFVPQGYALHTNLVLGTQVEWNSVAGITLSGELTVQEGELRKELLDERFASFYWDAASLRFNFDRGAAKIAATLSQNGVDVIEADVDLPDLKTTALSGEVAITQFQLQTIQPFVASFSSPEGYVNGRLKLSGTAEHPQVWGGLSVTDADFTLSAMPAKFQSLQLDIELQGDSATILGGVNVGDGQMDISGSVQLEPQPLAVLRLVGRKESLIFPPSVQAQVSHDLTLTASLEFLTITGELRVHEGELQHESLPQGGVGLSGDVVKIDYQGQEQERPAPFDIAMDVQVDIDDKFKVTGSIADVTVGGDLHLLQERGQPLQLFGNLNVLGGELRAYGQSLKVKRGSVSFAGAPDNPSLDMRAARIISADNVTVGMGLTGTLESPVLEVYSDPAMQQTEALSYLVRGRGLDAGVAADGTAMAVSMGSTLLNQSGVFGALDRLPGINSVGLSAEGSEEDTTATIGGYLGQRIYLSYGVGLYEPINVLTARFYVKTRLWLEVVSSLENSLDLYYSFDIE